MAALALTEISRGNLENQTAAAKLDAVGSLVVQLRGSQLTDSEAVKAEAAGAVWVLSENHPTNKESFAAAGSISPLVNLLAAGGARAQEHAANALASLGYGNIDNQSQITALLVSLLGNGSDIAKSNAAASLWRLVQENPTSQGTIANAGSVRRSALMLPPVHNPLPNQPTPLALAALTCPPHLPTYTHSPTTWRSI